MFIFEDLQQGRKKLAVIGLGYVGLPVALAFARKFSVIGFDINAQRVELMKKGIDPSDELGPEEFEGCNISFTASIDDLKAANFFVVAVPTPIDEHNKPDLRPLLAASATVGKALKKGDYVIFESTVYPGCTEEDCIPVLEAQSGLKFNVDFKVGYSPERINPGDREHTITKVKKVVSGSCDISLEEIAATYGAIIEAGVHKAPAMKVAEAAKIIENTQRDVNIALMNELSIIFSKMGINTYDVLEAAGTKWNFLRFYPGLVGGHCIGVDPYYLTYKASEVGYHSKVILSGRYVNDSMGGYIAKQVIKRMIRNNVNILQSRVLVMGATFKENVTDIRNSKVVDIIRELLSYSVNVEVVDPHASNDEFQHEYGIALHPAVGKNYDAIILAVSHNEYLQLDETYFRSIAKDPALIVDVKGILKNKIQHLQYWSL